MKPKIHIEDIEDRTLRVGESLKLTIHIDGEPPPNVEWLCNGKPLAPGVNIENVPYITKLSITKAVRYDYKKYNYILIAKKNARKRQKMIYLYFSDYFVTISVRHSYRFVKRFSGNNPVNIQ